MFDYERIERQRLGRRIALARNRQGITQEELATFLFFKQSDIYKYEAGLRMPKDTTLECIAKCLHVDFQWLKYGDESSWIMQETSYGKDITVRHFDDSAAHTKKDVARLLDKLEPDAISLVYETAEALYMDRNDYFLQEKLRNEYNSMEDQINLFKEMNSESRKAISERYEQYTIMQKVLPHVFNDFTERVMSDPEKEKELWKETNELAQNEVLRMYPELSDRILQQIAESNTSSMKETLVPLLLKAAQEKGMDEEIKRIRKFKTKKQTENQEE